MRFDATRVHSPRRPKSELVHAFFLHARHADAQYLDFYLMRQVGRKNDTDFKRVKNIKDTWSWQTVYALKMREKNLTAGNSGNHTYTYTM